MIEGCLLCILRDGRKEGFLIQLGKWSRSEFIYFFYSDFGIEKL